MSLSEPVAKIVEANSNGLLGSHHTWERVVLATVATVQNGFAFPSDAFRKDQGFPLIRIRDIMRGSTETGFLGDFEETYIVESGDLLVGMDGDFNSTIWTGPPGLLNQRVCRIIPNDSFYDLRFLAYALPGYLSAINAATSAITVKHLSSRSIEQIPMPLPPLAEQRRIVAEIDTQFTRLDSAEAALRRAQTKLRRYRDSILMAIVDGPDDDVASLLAAPLANGRSVGDRHNGFPVLRLTALRNGTIDPTQSKPGDWTAEDAKRYLIEEGDFLVARGNGSLSLVGRGGLVGSLDESVAFPDTMIRIRCDHKRMIPGFLRLAWNSPRMRRQIETTARTTAGIYKISQKDIAKFRLPVPPLEKQLYLVSTADELLANTDFIEHTLETAMRTSAGLRQSILQRAFSGQLVPQDPDDEPASVLLERIAAERASVAPPARKASARRAKATPAEVQRGLL